MIGIKQLYGFLHTAMQCFKNTGRDKSYLSIMPETSFGPMDRCLPRFDAAVLDSSLVMTIDETRVLGPSKTVPIISTIEILDSNYDIINIGGVCPVVMNDIWNSLNGRPTIPDLAALMATNPTLTITRDRNYKGKPLADDIFGLVVDSETHHPKTQVLLTVNLVHDECFTVDYTLEPEHWELLDMFLRDGVSGKCICDWLGAIYTEVEDDE